MGRAAAKHVDQGDAASTGIVRFSFGRQTSDMLSGYEILPLPVTTSLLALPGDSGAEAAGRSLGMREAEGRTADRTLPQRAAPAPRVRRDAPSPAVVR